MILAAIIGLVAGVAAGLLGIGGGALFVPALVFVLGLSQVDAEATSLLAIVPVAIVGARRQLSYGNLRVRDGLIIGTLAIPGAVAGVELVEVLPDRVTVLLFAALQLFVAYRMAAGAFRDRAPARP